MKQRLFVGINFDNATKLALAKIIVQLPNLPAINKAKIDKLHLTVQFLGDTEESLIPEIQTILHNTVIKYPPLQLSFTQIGAFPDWKYPNIIWIGMNGGIYLPELQTDLAQQLIKIVPTMDTKPFTPHLTLARITSQLNQIVIDQIQSIKNITALSTKVASIDLMTSTLTPQGAIYTLISRHQFAK